MGTWGTLFKVLWPIDAKGKWTQSEPVMCQAHAKSFYTYRHVRASRQPRDVGTRLHHRWAGAVSFSDSNVVTQNLLFTPHHHPGL